MTCCHETASVNVTTYNHRILFLSGYYSIERIQNFEVLWDKYNLAGSDLMTRSFGNMVQLRSLPVLSLSLRNILPCLYLASNSLSVSS
jgi:hypothetical protein